MQDQTTTSTTQDSVREEVIQESEGPQFPARENEGERRRNKNILFLNVWLI